MRTIANASADSLIPFVEEAVERGSVIRTRRAAGLRPIGKGKATSIRSFSSREAKNLQASSCRECITSFPSLSAGLMGTHHGAVSHEHLDYYLDEFTFRFNRRRSRARGHLFYRLLQQAVQVDPVPYGDLKGGQKDPNHNL